MIKTNTIKKYWYLYLTGALLALQAAVFLVFRGESYFQIHDNWFVNEDVKLKDIWDDLIIDGE